MSFELSSGYLETGISQSLHEMFIQPFGVGGQGGLRERRTVALGTIAIKRELRYDQNLLLYVHQGAVHLAALVLENSESPDLLGQMIGGALLVRFSNTNKNAQSRTDFRNPLAGNVYLGSQHSLDDDAHRQTELQRVVGNRPDAGSDKIDDRALHSDDGFGIFRNKEMCY